jgi:anti-anti-sigma regulatory factor
MARTSASGPNTADTLKALMEAGLHYRHIKTATDGGVLVITIMSSQLLDDVIFDGFLQELLAAVAQAGIGKVVVNFQAVKAICTGVFQALLELKAHLGEMRGRLVLCGLSPTVEEIFHLAALATGTGAPFESEPDVETAVVSVNGSKLPAG